MKDQFIKLKEFNFLDFLKSLPKRLTASLQDSWINFKANSLAHKIYVGLLLVTLISLLWMSQSTPISGDEFRYYFTSERIHKYFATNGKDLSATKASGLDPQHYAPATFDTVIYYIEKWLGIEDYMGLRHGANAFIGFLAILFASLIALRISGHSAAILTVIFLVLTPRFLGHCLNNHRDIPPVLSYVFTFYILLRYYREYPEFKIKTLFYLLVGLYSAYSIRTAGGLLLSAFMGFFMVSFHVYKIGFKNLLPNLFKKDSIKHLLYIVVNTFILTVVAIFLSSLLWPFLREYKLSGLLEVIRESNNIETVIKQLFEGKAVFSNKLPKYFTVKFMLISIPLVSFLGLILYVVRLVIERFRSFTFVQFTFLFSIIFPLTYAALVVTEYNGWRHFLIVYPFMVLLVIQGFLYFIEHRQNIIKFSAIGLLAVLLFLPLRFSALNHPYHYLYFNEFVGGLKKA